MHFEVLKTDVPDSSYNNFKIRNYVQTAYTEKQFLREVGPFPRACHNY